MKIKTLPPLVTPSEVPFVILAKSPRCANSLQISRSSDCVSSWQQYNEMKRFFFTQEIVQRASMHVLKCVSPRVQVCPLLSTQRCPNLTAKYIRKNRIDPLLFSHTDLGRPSACGMSRNHYHDTPYPYQSFSRDVQQIRVGRIAGQYAKPRSSGTERIGDKEVLSFRYVRLS